MLPRAPLASLPIFRPWRRSDKTRFEAPNGHGYGAAAMRGIADIYVLIRDARAASLYKVLPFTKESLDKTPRERRREKRPNNAEICCSSRRGRIPLRLAAARRRRGAQHHRQRRHVVGAGRAAGGAGRGWGLPRGCLAAAFPCGDRGFPPRRGAWAAPPPLWPS